MDEREPLEILASIRDKLLNVVDLKGHPCENCMDYCTVSSKECVECLVDQIIENIKVTNSAQ